MSKKLHVLHLARWYPSRVDSMLGLFVKNHIDALPEEVMSTVVFIWPVQGQKAVSRITARRGNIREITVTYPEHRFALINFWRFYRYTRREAEAVRAATPVDIIHVHVLTRMGVIGRLLAEKFGVPLVISESWSRYLQPAAGLRQWISYRLAGYAAAGSQALTYVSKRLEAALIGHGITSKRMEYIPNVVDTALFRPAEDSKAGTGVPKLVHISCFEEASKNISGLIGAVEILKNQGIEVKVCMIGDGEYRREAERKVEELGIADRFEFKGTLAPADVASEVAAADFLIQTSRYETFGAVVPEAWACGIPVISTQVGVFGEMYRPELGEEISGTEPASIAAGVKSAMDRSGTFSKELIRKTAVDHFGKEVVGAALKALYEDAIRAKNAAN